MIICKAPAFNPQGYVLAEVIGESTNSRGQRTIRVRALSGRPWDDYGTFGWSSTNTKKFYPENIEIVKIAKEQNEQVRINSESISSLI